MLFQLKQINKLTSRVNAKLFVRLDIDTYMCRISEAKASALKLKVVQAFS